MSGKRPQTDDNIGNPPKKHRELSAADKIEEVKARIAARKAKLEKKQPILDEPNPQQIDIKITSNVPKAEFATSKANLKRAEAVQNRLQKQQARKVHNPYFDPRTAGQNEKRIRPSLKFAEQGKFIKEAEKVRKDYEIEELKRKIAERKRKTGIEAEMEIVGENAIARYQVPSVEWWDAQFYVDGQISEDRIRENVTNLIHHPATIPPPTGDLSAPLTMVLLTSKEKKRARRLRRMEEQKEKREKIRLGLLPPEEPRLTMSNMMRVLGTEAVLDPTAVEAMVKRQTQERLEKHLRENEERKLKPEERSEKNWKKHEEDTSVQVHVLAFHVRDLSHPSHRFKVTKNAEQHHLTGLGIIYPQTNIIVVEGGPKGTRKYKNLMLNRINWKEVSDSNECTLLWEGIMKDQVFRKLRLRECDTPENVKDLLGSSYRYLWDLAKKQ